jgi:hypothetical protein
MLTSVEWIVVDRKGNARKVSAGEVRRQRLEGGESPSGGRQISRWAGGLRGGFRVEERVREAAGVEIGFDWLCGPTVTTNVNLESLEIELVRADDEVCSSAAEIQRKDVES